MKISKDDLDWAANQGIISSAQGDALWQAWSDLRAQQPQFNAANVAYYFGALIVISAMAWFMGLAWEAFSGGGLFLIATTYALLFIMAGRHLYFSQNLRIPGGLLFTIAVSMTPLAIYGLQRWTGFWLVDDPGSYRDFYVWIRGGWFFMELATIISSLVALWLIRFPFLVAPLAFSLWFMAMDIVPVIYQGESTVWQQRLLVSMWFGIAMIIAAYWVDLRSRRSQGDYGFWLYFFGLISFWGSLPLMPSETEWDHFLYCVVNLILMFLSILLRRRIFMIFGGLGVFGYLNRLAWIVFADSLLFPFALSALGIGIIYLGVLYQKHYPTLEQWIQQVLPEWMERLIPREN